MALTKDVKEIKRTLHRIEEILAGEEEMTDLERLEKEYKSINSSQITEEKDY